jgi:hypothetical protein
VRRKGRADHGPKERENKEVAEIMRAVRDAGKIMSGEEKTSVSLVSPLGGPHSIRGVG